MQALSKPEFVECRLKEPEINNTLNFYFMLLSYFTNILDLSFEFLMIIYFLMVVPYVFKFYLFYLLIFFYNKNGKAVILGGKKVFLIEFYLE
jgi:hypothetical protein